MERKNEDEEAVHNGGKVFFKVIHAHKLYMDTKKINQTLSTHSVVRIKVGISQL
jgi:hypothetical protein